MKLSPTQEEALKMMKEKGGGRLVRWPGGFWTYPGADGKAVYGFGGFFEYFRPEWSCSTNTVRALAKKGLVEIRYSYGREAMAVLKEGDE